MLNEKNEKNFKIRINQSQYEWPNSIITGLQVRQLGNIPDSDDVFLKVNGPAGDQLLQNDDRVDLTAPGNEHFYSQESKKAVDLIVNGRIKRWEKNKISFEEVIILAFGNYVNAATMVYTVAYEDGPKQNPEGTMVKGSEVFVKDKMIFHATATDKS